MNQHTQGPWQATHWRCHANTTVVVGDPSVLTGKRVIADVETTEADARLVAAAPDLPASLVKLLDAVCSNHEGGSPKTQDEIFAEAGHSAILAITKATGGAV
ncbi:MAG: hypothetical protein QM639_04420 [Rhodocyclaceae bacterium]